MKRILVFAVIVLSCALVSSAAQKGIPMVNDAMKSFESFNSNNKKGPSKADARKARRAERKAQRNSATTNINQLYRDYEDAVREPSEALFFDADRAEIKDYLDNLVDLMITSVDSLEFKRLSDDQRFTDYFWDEKAGSWDARKLIVYSYEELVGYFADNSRRSLGGDYFNYITALARLRHLAFAAGHIAAWNGLLDTFGFRQKLSKEELVFEIEEMMKFEIDAFVLGQYTFKDRAKAAQLAEAMHYFVYASGATAQREWNSNRDRSEWLNVMNIAADYGYQNAYRGQIKEIPMK